MSKKGFTLKNDGAFLTPEFRVSFPSVFQPNRLSGKFGLTMLFPKASTNMELFEASIEGLIKEKFPKGVTRNFLYPILDGDESDRAEQKGMWVINAKAGKYRPGVIDQHKQDIVDEAEFYPGCWARAVITLYSWDNSQVGKKGISVGLRNVQKLKDDEPLVSRVSAADEFDSVETSDADDL